MKISAQRRWNDADRENRSIRAETCPGATNFTYTARNRTEASAVTITPNCS